MSKRGSPEFQLYRDKKFKEMTAAQYKAVAPVFLGQLEGVRVYMVNGEEIRQLVDIDFVLGSNYAHSACIPEDEIYLGDLSSPNDTTATLVHEYVESQQMVAGKSYDKAHNVATKFEKRLRAAIQAGKVSVDSQEDIISTALDWI